LEGISETRIFKDYGFKKILSVEIWMNKYPKEPFN
jgi:hypothetical protein